EASEEPEYPGPQTMALPVERCETLGQPGVNTDVLLCRRCWIGKERSRISLKNLPVATVHFGEIRGYGRRLPQESMRRDFAAIGGFLVEVAVAFWRQVEPHGIQSRRQKVGNSIGTVHGSLLWSCFDPRALTL